MKYAVIDIGSNSVRLMLWADGNTFYKEVRTTRLGEKIASGRLSEAAMERTADAVCDFVAAGRREGATVLAFATAAVRSASNGDVFCECVKKRCGVSVDVVSGEREAELGILGALGRKDGGVVDIGGASTEICFRRNGEYTGRVSLPVGCVRLLDACKDDGACLIETVRAALEGLSVEPVFPVYAIGGTAYLMACLRRGRGGYDEGLQDLPLPKDWLRERTEELIAMPVEARKEIAGMDASRADISACGARLLYEIADKLGLFEFRFSCRDNLEGYLTERGLI